MPDFVVERAPAKINLDLRIVALEPDGYHSLDTTFQALELHDVLEARVADAFDIDVEGDIDVGPPSDNLVLRAARAFRDAVPGVRGARFRLEKRIPAGAGLGGGSSDAAAALRAMNALAGGPLPAVALRALGAQVGSDVPFFLSGATRAHARGRGEILTPLPPLEPATVVVVDPGFALSTRAAFGWWDELHASAQAKSAPAEASAAHHARTWAELARTARNDFEPVVFARYPQLGVIKRLLDAGALHALLSGSGSCLYGVFADAAGAELAAPLVRDVAPASRVILTRTAS